MGADKECEWSIRDNSLCRAEIRHQGKNKSEVVTRTRKKVQEK